MSLLDSLLTSLAPGFALNRRRAQLGLNTIKSYEAGGKGRRFNYFREKSTSANVEIGLSLPRLRNRHRALIRDNPWAENAVRAIVTNTVGYGIIGEIFDGVDSNPALTDLWLKWAEGTDCDAAGMNNFYGLQSLALQTTAESGEILIRRRWRRPEDKLPMPFQIELLEPDYLDHNKTQDLPNGGRIVQGVEFDVIGRRVAYWLFRDHPGDYLFKIKNASRVPAADVAHMFRTDRPQQVRGVPWGHAAIITLYDLDGFEDAFLLRQKLANCYMAVETETDAIASTDGSTENDLEDIEPGIVWRPRPGREMTFSSPPIAAEYGTYVDRVLYRIAAAYGVSYQALTGNLTRVNFSSGRMGWLDFQRNIQRWRKNMIIPQFNNRVAGWFFDAARLKGKTISKDVRFEWTPPRREMIDPSREVRPLRDAIRAGIISLPAVHREYGTHTARVLAEIETTNSKLDDMGIVLDSDPRKVSAAGLAQSFKGEKATYPDELTVNEKRELDGLDPIDGGDAIYKPASEIPAIEVE